MDFVLAQVALALSVRGRPNGKWRPGPEESFDRSSSTALTLNGGLVRTKSNPQPVSQGKREGEWRGGR